MTPRTTKIGSYDALVYGLEGQAELVHVPGFLGPIEARALFAFAERLPWERQRIRGVLTRRANVWLTDTGVAYRYSGQTWPPTPMTPETWEVASQLSAVAGEDFDAILGTFYPDGRAGVAYHADNEAIFGTDPTIASLSLGAARRFDVLHRLRAKAGQPDVSLTLEHGDLVLMRHMQQSYLHGLGQAAASIGPRVNLSFRRIERARTTVE